MSPSYALFLGTAAFVVAGAANEGPSYPDGFRQWVHVSSGFVGPGSTAYPRFGGLHDIYANPVALTGYKSGTFPTGSVLIFDVHEAKAGPGSYEPAERKQLDVMTKTNSGWQFVEYAKNSQTDQSVSLAQSETQCAACHQSARRDRVFSQFSD